MATSDRPLAIDLYCGLFGWGRAFADEGYFVVGFDIARRGDIPAGCNLVIQDVRTLIGLQFRPAAVIVASPPCDEFSRHDQPWTRARNPPTPDTSMWLAAVRIAKEAGVPLIIENVRGAQKFMGQAAAHFGKQYLWGEVPAILPLIQGQNFGRQKQSLSSSQKAERAKIPYPLAQHIARVFKPQRIIEASV